MQRPFRPIKRLGQHFLTDPNVARKIVDALRAPENARVVEIGAGTGALTDLLSARFCDLIAIEVDERAVNVLKERVGGVDIRQMDALAIDWATLVRGEDQLFVIGNLPYYITSQILFSLLECRVHIGEAVLMMQLEVAQRLVAVPRTKAYGILSVILQNYAGVEVLFRVSRNVFRPKPDVTSAVVRIVFREAGDREPNPRLFREVVRSAFNQRRKTLRNSLGSLLEERGCELPAGWGARRAEELTPEEFVALTNSLEDQPRSRSRI